MKVSRDAFLYLEPRVRQLNEDHAQCGPCRFFVAEMERCVAHGSAIEIDADDSCGFYLPWPTDDGKPVPEVVSEHAAELRKGIAGSLTPEESGLVDRRVQCHRCRFAADRSISRCGLFEKLNKDHPDIFDLDVKIVPHACCNAQMPKASEQEYQKMSDGERMAYARGSAVSTRQS